MDDIVRLAHLEELKRLKARYFLYLDHKQWARWGALFCEDAVMDVSAQFPEAPDPSIHIMRGRDAILQAVSKAVGTTITVHHGHAPVIDLHSEDEATGIWALEDNLFMASGTRMQGFGHYHERYRRIDGAWLISETRLTRLKILLSRD